MGSRQRLRSRLPTHPNLRSRPSVIPRLPYPAKPTAYRRSPAAKAIPKTGICRNFLAPPSTHREGGGWSLRLLAFWLLLSLPDQGIKPHPCLQRPLPLQTAATAGNKHPNPASTPPLFCSSAPPAPEKTRPAHAWAFPTGYKPSCVPPAPRKSDRFDGDR